MPKRTLALGLLFAAALAVLAAPRAYAAAGEEKLQKAIAEEEKQKAAEKAQEEKRKQEVAAQQARQQAEAARQAKAKQQALEAQCRFKPVMSDDDIAKCRAAYPSK